MTDTPKNLLKLQMNVVLGAEQPVSLGFAGLMEHVMPPNLPETEIYRLRVAFFNGAHHLFQMILAGLDPGEDITTEDLALIENIECEMVQFEQDVPMLLTKIKG